MNQTAEGGAQNQPLVEEWSPGEDLELLFTRLAGRRRCLFLDSALRHPELGRYSFLTAEPFDYLEFNSDQPGAIDALAREVAKYPSSSISGLPPFQGGAAGLFSYDLGRQLETIPAPRRDEFGIPALAVGLYDVVLAFDHVAGRSWLISHGWPEVDLAARRARAERRLREFRQWLSASPSTPAGPTEATRIVPGDALAPQTVVPGPAGLTSNFSKESYLEAVARAIEYIRAGDIFQVNLAQRLLYPAVGSPIELYLRLRRRNPATFAGYFDLGEFQIASASPERFLRVQSGRVEARPIKGTRLRTSLPEADLFAGDDLRGSEKDLAENVMIVDLMRNDLSKVCQTDSVYVSQLCGLESYAYVQHLVSVVQGELMADKAPLDLLRSAFPGGSITGAPKARAMEIIAELEPTARGAYCGSMGYLGFDGAMDANILIRSITAGRGWWQAPVGGGIVAQSTPQREYEETWHKAEGLLRSLT